MGHNILVVDDSATVRAFVRRAVKLSGIPVDNLYEAANGKAALELLAAHQVDAVLADLHMPEMDGEEMTRRIVADPATAGVPVVIVTAEPTSERIERLLKIGARANISKPFTPETIRDVLNRVIGVPQP